MTALTDPLPATRFAALVWTLAQRDLKARFKGTALGWLWSLIVPLATLAAYAVVFGVIFRAQVEPFGNGRDPIYAVWLFGGFIAFSFFSGALVRGADSLRSMASVLNRVRVPVLAPVLASLVSVGLQSVVELTLYLAVLAVLGNVGWTWLLLPAWALLFFCFCAGLAATFAIWALHLRDVAQVLVVALQMLFLATPIMYPLTMVPADLDVAGTSLREVLGASPLAHYIEVPRSLLYGLDPGTPSQWLYLLVAALCSLAVGAAVSLRYGQDAAEMVQ